jgi:hypothetical protein
MKKRVLFAAGMLSGIFAFGQNSTSWSRTLKLPEQEKCLHENTLQHLITFPITFSIPTTNYLRWRS